MSARRAPKKTTARSRARSASDEISVAPRILSSEEKRELILAHAAARHPVDSIQRASLWAGVFICVAFIIGAWFYTVGSGIKRSLAQPMDPSMERSLELATEMLSASGTAPGFSNDLKNGLETFAARLEASAQEQAIINAMASSSLFKPQPDTPPTSTVTTTH
jgi:hypothetical protein